MLRRLINIPGRLVKSLPLPFTLQGEQGIGQRSRDVAPRRATCGSSPTGPAPATRRPARSARRTAVLRYACNRGSGIRRPALAISSKARSTASSPAQSWSSRMPGVSISAPPPGSGISSRCVVVWRPRLSDSRTSAVRRRSSPSRQFTSDDLPTPETPSKRHGSAVRQIRAQRTDTFRAPRVYRDDRAPPRRRTRFPPAVRPRRRTGRSYSARLPRRRRFRPPSVR